MRPAAHAPLPGRVARPVGGSRARALSATVAALVLGILGMHALTLHGPHHASAAVALPAAAAQAAEAGGHAGHGAPSAATGATSHDSQEGHGSGGMVMLCAAMVVAASAGLLLLRRLDRAGRGRVVTRLPRAAVVSLRPVTAYLPTGPPAVWRFSVIRC